MSPSCKRGKPRLEHWLWRKVDSEACTGVRWVNKAQRIFKIPWINQKKSSEWREELSQLFTEYARHKGKLNPGGIIEYPKFKQNFKSAIGKCKAVKRLCKGNSKMYRLYKFDADYSSSDERVGGNYQLTRNQSHDIGEDNSSISQALDSVGTSHVFTDQPRVTQPDMGEDLSGIDFLQDGGELFPGQTEMTCGFSSESLQDSSGFDELESLPLSDDNAMAGMVQDLHLSPIVDISVTENSQIQNTTVDSTTGSHNTAGEFAMDEQKLAASLQINRYDIIERENRTSTHLINSNMSMAGCSMTVHTDAKSAPLLNTQVEDKTILDNIPAFLNRTMEVQINHAAVSLTTSQQRCFSSSSSSMETSEQQSNHNQGEAALPISVSSSTSTETTNPRSLTSTSPGNQAENIMAIQVIYSSPQRVVKKTFITSNKCKIFFGRVDSKRLQKVIEERDNGAVLVELPSVDDSEFDEGSKTRIAKTLDRMELGVVISYRDNDIYVIRRCQSHVFLTDGVSTSVSVPRSHIKEPDQEIKAFDFAAFEKSVTNYKQTKTGTIDRDHFVLTLGCEILKNDPSPSRVVPVRIDVQHWKAAAMRFTTLGPAAYVPDPQHSMSDSFDNQIHLSNFPIMSMPCSQ